MSEQDSDGKQSVIERWKQGMPTEAELEAFPRRLELVDASRTLGIGRDRAYDLAKEDRFPIHLAKVGPKYFASKAELLRELDSPGSVRPELRNKAAGAA